MTKKNNDLIKNVTLDIDQAIKQLRELSEKEITFLPKPGYLSMISRLENIRSQVLTDNYTKQPCLIGRIVIDSWPFNEPISKLLIKIDSEYESLQRDFLKNNSSSNNMKM